MKSAGELLVRHFRQLRSTRGTVLLGPAELDEAALRLDPGWFVDGCPLEPDAALEVLARRHGFADREAAAAALRDALEEFGEGGDRALLEPAGAKG